jgi:hypothetical protein
MASIIPEPASTNPATADWQMLLSKTTQLMVGLDATVAQGTIPIIKSGSVFEMSGSYYQSTSDETPTEWPNIATGNIVFIYALPGTDSASFFFSITEPVYDSGKRGWYDGANRALWKMFKDTTTNAVALQQLSNILGVIPITKGDPANALPGQIWLRVG